MTDPVAKSTRLQRAKHFLEPVVATLVIFDIVDKVFQHVFSKDLYDLLIDTTVWLLPSNVLSNFMVSWIIYVFGFALKNIAEVSLFVALVLLVVFARDRNTIHTINIKLQHLTEFNTGLQSYNARYRLCEEVFRKLARQNARCDREIFHILFANAQPGNSARIIMIEAAMRMVSANIIHVLDAAAELFQHVTGDECAACIQVTDRIHGKDISEAVVRTTERDAKSATRRPLRLHGRLITTGHVVKDNTINTIMCIEGRDILILESLKEKVDAGIIKISSSSVGKVYDAVLLAAVPDINKVVTLCVDNMMGGFERNPVCEHFAKELVWRISVMLFRLESLGLELRKLKPHDPEEA